MSKKNSIVFNAAEAAVLPNATAVTPDKIKEMNINVSAYSMRPGDKVTFDIVDEKGQPVVYSRPLNPTLGDKSPIVNYLAVTRQGIQSWLSIGTLTRRDFNRQATCKVVEDCLKAASFLDMFHNLLEGNTITCTKMEKKQFQKFDAATRARLEGEYEERETPIIEWCEE